MPVSRGRASRTGNLKAGPDILHFNQSRGQE
jgi:hypothetical protein